MKYDIDAFNWLRFGLLPGVGILIIMMAITSQWTIALELLLVASIPPLLGTVVLGCMLSTMGYGMKKRLNNSIEQAQYMRPMYVLTMFVLVSITVAMFSLLRVSPNIVLPLSLLAVLLLTLVISKVGGNRPQPTRNDLNDKEYSYGYRGEYIPTGKSDPVVQSGMTDELPVAQYEESVMR